MQGPGPDLLGSLSIFHKAYSVNYGLVHQVSLKYRAD